MRCISDPAYKCKYLLSDKDIENEYITEGCFHIRIICCKYFASYKYWPQQNETHIRSWVLLQRLVSKSVALKLAFKCWIPNAALHPSVAIQVWLCLQVAALHYLSLPRLMERTIRVGKCAYVAQTQLRPFVTSERLLCNLVRAEAWWCTYAWHGSSTHMLGKVVHICWVW